MGYDLYVQMVSEAVAELKGEEPKVPAEVKLEVPVTANLPPDYVARDDVRLEAYRRLANVTTDAEVDGRAELHCTSSSCGLQYRIDDGVPVLLVDEARKPA